jgi:glutamyl-tRNA synthetase
MPVRGRYAPSPTGAIHLGNASTALVSWLSVRAAGGAYVLRTEDLDRPRVVPGADERILTDLAWLGLDWDEGPDVSGPYAPYVQSARQGIYRQAFDTLRERGLVYPCFCSRKDVAAAASAPQAPGDEALYPGTCRGLSEDEVARRRALRREPTWRFRVDPAEVKGFVDLVRGPFEPDRATAGDFVVLRADGVAAYQLAVVVDDAAMAITEVVRGSDLIGSTWRQSLLYVALGKTPPAFGHVPLLLGDDGVRLSKRHRGTTLAELREAGFTPERVVGGLAQTLGLRRAPGPARAGDLVPGFDLSRLRHAPPEIVVDPRSW